MLPTNSFGLLFGTLTVRAGDWQAAWQNGWREGYRREAGDFAIPPIPPIPPFPPLGHNRYEDAFVDGVLAGAEAARCRH